MEIACASHATGFGLFFEVTTNFQLSLLDIKSTGYLG